jgi:hypothetical protein
MPDTFDAQRARLEEPDMFLRFRVPDEGLPLAEAGLKPQAELLIAERAGVRRAFSVRQMAYHHAAQGQLGDEPYLVTF